MKNIHDEVLKTAVRAGTVPLDILSMETSIGEQVASFKKLLQEETQGSAPSLESNQRVEDPEAATEDSATELSAALQTFLDGMQSRVGDQAKSPQVLEAARSFEEKARSLFHSNVELHVMPASETELYELLSSSKAVQIRGQDDKWVGIIADPGQFGEAITNPNVRPPPFNQLYLKTFLNSVVKTRDATSLTLHSRDLYCLFDNFAHHHGSSMLKSLCNPAGQALSKNTFQVSVCYDEDALSARRQYVKRESTAFDQIEFLQIVTADPFNEQMKHRARTHFSGSSLGNKIGDVKVDAPATLWNLSMKAQLC